MHRIGAGRFLHVCQQIVHRVKGYPVEHDAGDDLVYVAVAFEDTAYSAEDCAGRHGQKQAHPPGQLPRKRRVDRNACAECVLAGSAYIEQADLIRKQDRQRAHQQRRGFYKRAAEILERYRCVRVVEKVLYKACYCFACACRVYKQQNHIAQKQAEQDADY